MARDKRHGLINQPTRDLMLIIRRTAKESMLWQMETRMMGIGVTISYVDKGRTNERTEGSFRGSLRMILRMVRVFIHGQTDVNTLAPMKTTRNTGTANLSGKMEEDSRATGPMASSMALGDTTNQEKRRKKHKDMMKIIPMKIILMKKTK